MRKFSIYNCLTFWIKHYDIELKYTMFLFIQLFVLYARCFRHARRMFKYDPILVNGLARRTCIPVAQWLERPIGERRLFLSSSLVGRLRFFLRPTPFSSENSNGLSTEVPNTAKNTIQTHAHDLEQATFHFAQICAKGNVLLARILALYARVFVLLFTPVLHPYDYSYEI